MGQTADARVGSGPTVYDLRMNDGSRHFGSLPETYDTESPQWHRLRAHLETLPGAALTRFVTDDVTEAWLEWTWREHAFSLNDQHGEWWFFVADPRCPDALLEAVLTHFEVLLAPTTAFARAAGPLARGQLRVVVLEPDGRVHHRDFEDAGAAQAYAADVRYEVEDDQGSPIAVVLDEGLPRL